MSDEDGVVILPSPARGFPAALVVGGAARDGVVTQTFDIHGPSQRPVVLILREASMEIVTCAILGLDDACSLRLVDSHSREHRIDVPQPNDAGAGGAEGRRLLQISCEPGSYLLVASRLGEECGRVAFTAPLIGNQYARLDIAPVDALRGQIVGLGGGLPEGGLVLDVEVAGGRILVPVESEGHFELPVHASLVSLRVSPPSYSIISTSRSVGPESLLLVRVALSSELLVTGLNGGDNVELFSGGQVFHAHCALGENGNVLVKDLPPGVSQVRVGLAVMLIDLQPGQRGQLDWSAGSGNQSVSVDIGMANAPTASCRVFAACLSGVGPSAAWHLGRWDNESTVSFAGLAPGAHLIVLQRPGATDTWISESPTRVGYFLVGGGEGAAPVDWTGDELSVRNHSDEYRNVRITCEAWDCERTVSLETEMRDVLDLYLPPAGMAQISHLPPGRYRLTSGSASQLLHLPETDVVDLE